MRLAHLTALALILALCACQTSRAPRSLERVVLSSTGKGFILERSGKPVTPWGFNYGNNGRLIEDFWDTEWRTVEQDWTEMRDMGGNVVRVHLQFNKLMRSPTEPNPESLARLKDLVKLSERTGLYLDLTGLACYRPSDVPPWYDRLSDDERWKAQAVFWGAIARTCHSSPALFCYDLMNEPISPNSPRKPGEWYSGKLLGEFDFLQSIALNPRRSREENARAWIETLTRAIREHDSKTPITVGMLPWVKGWGHLFGFIPAEVAESVDFLSIHIYPAADKPEEAAKALSECDVGKTVVIEETFPLSCSADELKAFLHSSKEIASGWIIHYDGTTIAELEQLKKEGKITILQSIWLSGLQLFTELRPEFVTL